MAEELTYRVVPAEPAPVPQFKIEVSPWGTGCLFLTVAFLVSISVTDLDAEPERALMVLGTLLAAALVLSVLVPMRRRAALLQAKTAEWMGMQLERSEREARELTQKASDLIARFEVNARSLPGLVSKADLALKEAEADFQERAYAPFWDKIEEAAVNLGSFNACLRRLESDSGLYRSILTGSAHNFPALGMASYSIPNPASTIERLVQLVRKSQRDFEFTTVWEHRRTRQALIEGFRTIGDAVSNLGSTTEDSFSRLTYAIEDSSTQMREEQVRLREKFEASVARWEKQRQRYRA